MAWLGGSVGTYSIPLLALIFEAQTGVTIAFWDMAPSISFFGASSLEWIRISPEILLIPGLVLLAIAVGVYPAISAYKTDVAESLSS